MGLRHEHIINRISFVVFLSFFVFSKSGGARNCVNQFINISDGKKFFFFKLNNFPICFTEFGGSVDVAAITNFIDNGGNVLIAASSSIGKSFLFS